MTEKLKILFVCPLNRMRSATAHKIFQSDPRFEVDSAGTDKSADTVLEPEHLEWADAVIVMEKAHSNFIRQNYPEYYAPRRLFVSIFQMTLTLCNQN